MRLVTLNMLSTLYFKDKNTVQTLNHFVEKIIYQRILFDKATKLFYCRSETDFSDTYSHIVKKQPLLQ